jgi:hypothetical protein
MRYLSAFTIFLLAGSADGAEALTERRISSADIGTLVFMAPEKWQGEESYDDLEAATVYELSSRRENLRLRLTVRYFGSELDDSEIIERLDAYLKYAIAEQLENPARYEVRAARFAPRNHGIYARIYDRNAVKGEFPYYSHGGRILSDKFIAFSLHSNDADLSVLTKTLDVIMSFDAKQEWAGAPESFLCKGEQLVGFDFVDGEWTAVNSEKVRQSIAVRRSRSGDTFADSSEWVFLGSSEEAANSSCNNESISRGVFICSSSTDEHFRMDSKTMRFTYSYLGGYHNVPDSGAPDDESSTPNMVIGSCTAQ